MKKKFRNVEYTPHEGDVACSVAPRTGKIIRSTWPQCFWKRGRFAMFKFSQSSEIAL